MQGKNINGYTLQRMLGIGGMAEVWLAENRIGKKAAVKILLPKLCDDENVSSRFLTEAKVMVVLNHPNIRQVYDFGDIDGRPCIIMEYLEGEDLKSKLKHGKKFSEKELESWWNQLVDALNYTHHAKGIVHRDLKPGNIFVDTNIPLDILSEISDYHHVAVMLSPQSMSVERFFDRSDPEKQFLLNVIDSCEDPAAVMENYRQGLARINSQEHYQEYANSGFFTVVREDNGVDTREAVCETIARHFGLLDEEGKS